MPNPALACAVAGDGPCIVLVHGHPFNRSMWAPQVAALHARFRVVAPDLRGYGESPVSPGIVEMATLADDVWSTLDALALDAVAVVGLSMGGLVAMEMASGQPERVWALGLVATTAEPITDGERSDRLMLADRIEEVGIAPLVERMAPDLLGPDVDPALARQVRAMMVATDPRGAAAAMRGRAVRPDYRPCLRALDVPSFVCTGTRDPWSTEAVTRELVASLASPRTVTLPDVGHMPNLERPEEFNAELARFLTDAWEARA